VGCHRQKQFSSASPALAVQDCIQETALRNITQSIILPVLAEINGLWPALEVYTNWNTWNCLCNSAVVDNSTLCHIMCYLVSDVLFKARHMSAKYHITLDGQLVKVNRSHKVTNSGVLSHHLWSDWPYYVFIHSPYVTSKPSKQWTVLPYSEWTLPPM